jgi:cellulose synthase/poly-beta-1,6-N-acetylglucosamine synthase-like glycosyltransferase
MEPLVSGGLITAAALIAVPVGIFCLEIVAAVLRANEPKSDKSGRGVQTRVAVLVPAHDEGTGLQPTLSDIKNQLQPSDRLLVVADNCTDDTAVIAAAAGAEVIERQDPTRIGKGYALDFGISHLSSDPPDVVIIIDADCRLGPEAISHLASACAATRRPAQALYLMTTPEESQINHQVAEFAWRVKNWLRPLGLSALGMPCQLMGTGMAIPWDVVRLSDLANGWIVEDLKLGLDLAAAGHAPLFCPAARVTSQFATSVTGAKVQRSRWEQGHIHTILATVPRLLARAVAQRNWALLALTLDLAVPPLSLLVVLTVGLFGVIVLLTALFGLSVPAVTISTLSVVALLLATILAWFKCGRDILPARRIPLIATYILSKLGLYRRIVLGRVDAKWVRTDRKNSGNKAQDS